MRARWTGVDKNIRVKMCWKFVDDVSGEIICRSTISSVIEPDTANIQVDPIKPIPPNTNPDYEDNLLVEFISLADFDIPFWRFNA